MSKRGMETFGFLSKLLNKKHKVNFCEVFPVWNEIFRPRPKLLVKKIFSLFIFFFLIINIPFSDDYG